MAKEALGYSVDSKVTQFGKTGDELKKYKFIGICPYDISPIDVDWGANDQIEEFTITMAYQWWEAEKRKCGLTRACSSRYRMDILWYKVIWVYFR